MDLERKDGKILDAVAEVERLSKQVSCVVLAALIYGLVKSDKDPPGSIQNTKLILHMSESGQRCETWRTSLTFNHALLLRQSLNIKMMVSYLQAHCCHSNL